jgi:hypothetical protein
MQTQGQRIPHRHNGKPPFDDGGISKRLSIVIFDPQTREETRSPVRERLNGAPVTEEMVKRDIAAANKNCTLHGRTGEKIRTRSVFRLEYLQ